MTLVELLVATGLLAIVLTALAGTLVATLGSITRTEHEVIATQLVSELAEEVQIGHFDFVALYEDEIDPSKNALAAEWAERLDDPAGTFDGNPLVTVPGPDGTRDGRYPEPVVPVTREGVDFRVDRYVTWIDRDGDGNVETKRLTSIITWIDSTQQERELRFESERVPTQSEAVATDSGTRVISFTFTPDPVELDATTGALLEPVEVHVRTNEGVTGGSLDFYTYDDDTGKFVLQEVTMTAGEQAVPSSSGWVTWTATLDSTVDPSYTFDDGPVDFLFQALDASLADVEALGTLVTFGGPWEFANTPTPDGTNSGEDVVPSSDPDPSDPPATGSGDPVDITVTQQPTQLCVDNGSSKLSQDVRIEVSVVGLTQEDGQVKISYPYYSNKNKDNPDETADDLMTFVSESGGAATYGTTIAAGSKIFKDGETVTFTIEAKRADGAVADDRDTESFSVVVDTC